MLQYKTNKRGDFMNNLFISNLDKKDVNHFTSDFGLKIRKDTDKPFKKICNKVTNVNIIRINNDKTISDEKYFETLSPERIPLSNYSLAKGKENIVLERYPELKKNEPYIFVCNHSCPEDIETVLNILDRNTYLVLGSIDSLKHNPEMYLSWLNGMIPFDILDKQERQDLIPKMARVLKSNSILIFPEGSHNYSPNKIINKLFDGPVNLSLKTNRKIVIVTLIRDNQNKVSYIDVSNPVDFASFNIKKPIASEDEKNYVNSITNCIRNKMATAEYNLMLRHFDQVKRYPNDNYEEIVREEKVNDAFTKLKWNADVFDAEYLIKKDDADRQYEEVLKTMSNLKLNSEALTETNINTRNFVQLEHDLNNKDVAQAMRRHFNEQQTLKLIRKK
jgi:hypothetical protein